MSRQQLKKKKKKKKLEKKETEEEVKDKRRCTSRSDAQVMGWNVRRTIGKVSTGLTVSMRGRPEMCRATRTIGVKEGKLSS
jgi:hypothetical protein